MTCLVCRTRLSPLLTYGLLAFSDSGSPRSIERRLRLIQLVNSSSPDTTALPAMDGAALTVYIGPHDFVGSQNDGNMADPDNEGHFRL